MEKGGHTQGLKEEHACVEQVARDPGKRPPSEVVGNQRGGPARFAGLTGPSDWPRPVQPSA